jgi:hypothetical protein
MGRRRRGVSYKKRVLEVNRIYGEHVPTGLSNREIWVRYIYPVYGISERTFYNILNASVPSAIPTDENLPSLFDDNNGGQ